jgi:hypothetical protein
VVREAWALVAGVRRLAASLDAPMVPILELLQELVGFLAGEAPPLEFRHDFWIDLISGAELARD